MEAEGGEPSQRQSRGTVFPEEQKERQRLSPSSDSVFSASGGLQRLPEAGEQQQDVRQQQQERSMPAPSQETTLEEERALDSGRDLLLYRASSSPISSESSFSQWKRSTRRWLKGAVLYARCRPLLVVSFIFFSAAHVLLSVAFLRLFPCPLLLTWAQLSQSVFYAFILGEAGDAFAAFRSLFPSTSRTLYRAYVAVAAHRTTLGGRHHGEWQSSAATQKIHRRAPDGSSSFASSGSETAADAFWKHRSGLLLQLLLRLLPYSLGYCLLQYAHNVLAAHVVHPLQLPIVSSLALAAQECLYYLSRKVGSASKAASSTPRKQIGSGSEAPPSVRGAAGAMDSRSRGDITKGRQPDTAATAPSAPETVGATRFQGANGETELIAAGALTADGTRSHETSSSASPFSSEVVAAGSSKYTWPGAVVARRYYLPAASSLVRLMSLLFLAGGPGLYIYWQSSSPLFAAPAIFFVLASLVYRSWLLPKALHLPRCSSNSNKGVAPPTAASLEPPAGPRDQEITGMSYRDSPETAADPYRAISSFSSFSFRRRETSFSSSSAVHATSCFRPKEISLLHNLTGALLLLLPGLLCGEQHYTTFPFRFLLSHQWYDWLAAGCWISLGTISFLRRTTSSSIMREAGASIWKVAELLALLCVGCCSWFFFGNPGPAAVTCCCVVILGRLLNLAASPLVHHRRHHHYHYPDILLQEKQQQQIRILPTNSAAALVVTSAPPGAIDRSPSSHDQISSFRDRSTSSRFSTRITYPSVGVGSMQALGGESSSIIDRSSSSTIQSDAGTGTGDYVHRRSFGPLVSRNYSSTTYSSRDDMPAFTFPSSGRRSFAIWTAEAASRAAAAAELPSVRLLEEPDMFLRPHRRYLLGRRFPSGTSSFSEYDTLSFRDAAPCPRAATQASPLAEERAAAKTSRERSRPLSVIGEEEEEGEDGQRQGISTLRLALPPPTEDGATTIAVSPEPPGEAGGKEDQEDFDEEEVEAASKRGYLMEIVRAYVSRTTYEDLLLLEEWGGTTGVAAAVGANLLQGLPDEKRRGRDVSSSSSEDEKDSTTEDEETEEEEDIFSVAISPERRIASSRVSPSVAADTSVAPTGQAAAARGWPGNIPRRRKKRFQRGGRQQQKTPMAEYEEEAKKSTGRELLPVPENGREGVRATGGEEEVVQEQRRLYGVNRLPRRPLSSFFSLCLEAASDATLKVLMFCGLMSLVLALLFSKEPETEVIEGLAIWVAVLVVVLVTAGNDWMKEQQFALLSAVKDDKLCAVIRGGEAKQLSVFDVVVGDLLQLEAGDEIPADALLVQGRDVKVDESSLTGESDPIAKETYSICMQGVHQLQGQQQLPPIEGLPPLAIIPEIPSSHKQTAHQDEEGESLAVSTAAESIHMAPLTSRTIVQQEVYHSSPAPSSASDSVSSSPHPASRVPVPSSASSADRHTLQTLQPPSTRCGDPNSNTSSISRPNTAADTVGAGTRNTNVSAGTVSTGTRDANAPAGSVSTEGAFTGNLSAASSNSASENVAAQSVVGSSSSSSSSRWLGSGLGAETTLSPSLSPSAGKGIPSSPNGDSSSHCMISRHHLVPSPVLLSGTTLSTGSCTALVVAVGSYSQVGQTFQKLAFDPEPTPLQMKLNALAEDIGNFGLAAAVAAFIVLLFEFWILFYLQPASARATLRAVDILHEHVEFFVTAITILVVAVPEGLPLAVTISLAYSISQMLREQNYVRRLAACEIMGGANEICSDKTGTLTKNQMTVTVFWQGTSPIINKQAPASSSSTLLLYVPVGSTTTKTDTGDTDEEQKAKAQKHSFSTPASADSVAGALPARKESSRDIREAPPTSARGGRSGGAATAADFSKDYTQPLLEAEISTTGRSTEAETLATTRRSAGKHTDDEDAQEKKYVAWSKGEKKRQQDRKWLLLAEAIAANSTAFLEREEDDGEDNNSMNSPEGDNNVEEMRSPREQQETAPEQAATISTNARFKHVGSPTECALLAFSVFQCHKNYDFLRRQLLGEEGCNLVERREFTSDRKMMTSIIRLSPEALELEKRFQKQQTHTDASETKIGKNATNTLREPAPQVGSYRVFVKGAAERVLHQCSHVLVSDDEQYALTPTLVSTIEEQVINTMASRALRTICIAYKDLPPGTHFPSSSSQGANSTDRNLPYGGSSGGSLKEKGIASKAAPSTAAYAGGEGGSARETAGAATDVGTGLFDIFESDLICLGIAGIEDPVRDEVPDAVLQCQAAGIRVRMVTGDNLLTARAIAAQCNIYHEAEGGLALLGSDFIRRIGGVVCQRCGTEVCDCATDSKTAEEEGRPLRTDVIKNLEAFQAIWKRLEVLARSQPTDKYALVCALQQLHRVVAVTGDGTNDAPALRKADVGFAMGLSGKEVAKQAADIVMLDDNFTCIVKAVRWGRSVYDNIRRFLQFQLTVNVVAVLLTVICIAIEREAPLSAVQMLWINLIMDSFASLALATEPPTDALLRRKPHGRDSYLVSKVMLASILVAACYQVTVMLLLIFYGEKFLPETPWKFVAPQQRLKYSFCEFSDGNPEQCMCCTLIHLLSFYLCFNCCCSRQFLSSSCKINTTVLYAERITAGHAAATG